MEIITMDNEIQKLKSKACQSHDYKHAEICQSEDTKHPEPEGDIGILQKTHYDCFNAAAEDIRQQLEIQEIEIPSFYANKRIIGMSTIIQELANNYLNGNDMEELRQANMDEVQKMILSLLKPDEQPITRALKEGFISNELLT
ncbi:hypothetical protein H5410_056675 [Solanum commersonii]|uniref:Uncharacterized protein n=1 Tax=Solanum commersonii TaxID=4109 RepID=A0A9J5WMF8_SOLCO|nr:hypothetical protein H5410_056675 [Solanum commersonii]